MTWIDKPAHYPVGARITVEELIGDPYPVYSTLLAQEPVSWIACLGMWWVVGYRQVSEILMDSETFVTDAEQSTIRDTFGSQMLSVEGVEHGRYKNAARPAFQQREVTSNLETKIVSLADSLIDGFSSAGAAELKSVFCSRLPVQTMLSVFGLPEDDEPVLRTWYDSFERGLANFTWDEGVRTTARRNVAALHSRLEAAISRERLQPSSSLLGRFIRQPEGTWRSDAEICRNASIILFGGISTVEALILNAVWALGGHVQIQARMHEDFGLMPRIVEEVIRWHAPVQSATRQATRDIEFHGHKFRRGDIVNCMLGAANRDPTVFSSPDLFDIDRSPQPRHLGFALGPHVCLGLHLARLEARIGIERLYRRLPGLRPDPRSRHSPRGYEFHQPERLDVIWNPES